MRILGVIPARYESTRFPGKPLVDICGKSMIQRVYNQCQKSNLLMKVVVATDDDRIYKHVHDFGGEAVMTSKLHKNGTERVNEAASLCDEIDFVVNIQGDEPFIDPSQINALCKALLDNNAQLATLGKLIDNADELFNPNVVKLVKTSSHKALYFSRSPIPYQRGLEKDEWLKKGKYIKHIGIYGYRIDVLKEIIDLVPSELELAESLEQLRWLIA